MTSQNKTPTITVCISGLMPPDLWAVSSALCLFIKEEFGLVLEGGTFAVTSHAPSKLMQAEAVYVTATEGRLTEPA